LAAPELIAGRYRLVNRIAAGGMGSVWEAWDELLRRRVAVKQLLLQPGMSSHDAELARSRVIREARITARLHHPHAVALYDVVEHHGEPCLIMQYVPAPNLNQLLKERGVLNEPVVARIGAELSAALAAAHEVGIVHRDVKPSNVLITADGSAKLTDFGISHAAGDVTLTSTGMITGTPAFLAPEVARGEQSGFGADVFSLGATMYAALEGTPPFGTDENQMALLHKVGSGRISPPLRSGALTEILLQMLSIEPAARPSMSDVSRALNARPPAGTLELPASDSMTVDLPPRTIRHWPPDHRNTAAVGPSTLGAEPMARSSVPELKRRRTVGAILAVAAVLAAVAVFAGYLILANGNNAQPTDQAEATSRAATAAKTTSLSAAGSTWTPGPSPAVALPAPTVPSASPVTRPTGSGSAGSAPAAGAPDASSPSTSASTPAKMSAAPAPTVTSSSSRPKAAPTRSASPRTTVSSAASMSAAEQTTPTAAELAGAITDYYALMPSGSDQGWDRLTARFQSTTAQNRPYYERFWGGISRVIAEDVQGAAPDKAEATITYYFDDGRVAVERTAYTLVPEGGTLKIDTSTVLSSDNG